MKKGKTLIRSSKRGRRISVVHQRNFGAPRMLRPRKVQVASQVKYGHDNTRDYQQNHEEL